MARITGTKRKNTGGAGPKRSTTITRAQLEEHGRVVELLAQCGLTKSNGEGRRLIAQGAVQMNDAPVDDPDAKAQPDDTGTIMLKKGKIISDEEKGGYHDED